MSPENGSKSDTEADFDPENDSIISLNVDYTISALIRESNFITMFPTFVSPAFILHFPMLKAK